MARRRLQVPAVVGLASPDGAGVGVVVHYVPQTRSNRFLDGNVHVLTLSGSAVGGIEGHQGCRRRIRSCLELCLVESVL